MNENKGVLLKGHGAAVTDIKRLNNSFNRLVSSSLDGNVMVWEVYSGSLITTYKGHDSGI
jgi:WD40 repeat protein